MLPPERRVERAQVVAELGVEEPAPLGLVGPGCRVVLAHRLAALLLEVGPHRLVTRLIEPHQHPEPRLAGHRAVVVVPVGRVSELGPLPFHRRVLQGRGVDDHPGPA